MASPVFTSDKRFQPSRANFSNQFSFSELSADSTPMTMENTLKKTGILFIILVAFAAVGWLILPPALLLPFVIAALIVGLVNSFKKEPSVPLIVAYSALEGVVVGLFSSYFEAQWPGVVWQAVLATLCVVGITLALFANGTLRATPKMTKIFLIAMFGYIAFSLLNFVLMITGVTSTAFGLRGVELFGFIPLGLIVGVFAVILGAYSLVMDFTFIQNGVNNRLPQRYGWTAGFGILVTVVWLYLEILRMLGLVRR